MEEEKSIEVVDTNGVCSRLKCSRMTLYNKYKDKLEQVPFNGKKNFFTLRSVNDLMETINKPEFNGKYKVVE